MYLQARGWKKALDDLCSSTGWKNMVPSCLKTSSSENTAKPQDDEIFW